MTKVIEKLKIPVVVLGAGLQSPLPYAAGKERVFDDTVKAFAAAVLDRSPTIGVRGEYTQDYLQRLGFRDIEVIGCPSMFLRGDQLSVTKRVPSLTPESRIAFNLTRRVDRDGAARDLAHRSAIRTCATSHRRSRRSSCCSGTRTCTTRRPTARCRPAWTTR